MYIALLILSSFAILAVMFFIFLYGFMVSTFVLGSASNSNNVLFAIVGYIIALLTIALEFLGVYFLLKIWSLI